MLAAAAASYANAAECLAKLTVPTAWPGLGAVPRAEPSSSCSTLSRCVCSSSRRRKRSRSPRASHSPSRLRQRHGNHKRHGGSRGSQGRHRSSFEGPDGRGDAGAGPPCRGGLGPRGPPGDMRYAGGQQRWRGGPGESRHAAAAEGCLRLPPHAPSAGCPSLSAGLGQLPVLLRCVTAGFKATAGSGLAAACSSCHRAVCSS